MTGALMPTAALLLFQGSQGAFVATTIDLVAIRDEGVVTLPVAPGARVSVFIGNRAPSGLYRVKAEKAGAAPVELELPRPPATAFTMLPSSPPCTTLQNRAQELLRLGDETGVPEKWKALAEVRDCPSLRDVASNAFQGTRGTVPGLYVLAPGEVARITIERLDPRTKATQRRWNVVIEGSAPGASPTSPVAQWPYPNEGAWLVGETAHDITEMALFAKTGAIPDPKSLAFALKETPCATVPTWVVTARLDASPQPFVQSLSIDDYVWSPKAYEALARALLERFGLKTSTAVSARHTSPLQALHDLRAATLETENKRVSLWLAREMSNPAAHEEAALLLGALGLREAKGAFADTRLTLCRMAAHLALAGALRATSPPSSEGAYAHALLLTLAGRQRSALQRVDALRSTAARAPSQTPWLNALTLRNTHDWRVLKNPETSTLLERLEYTRALTIALGSERTLEFLEKHPPEPIPDWGRATLTIDPSVNAGNLFVPSAVGMEMSELAELWKASRGTNLSPSQVPAALNVPPDRCVSLEGPAKAVPHVIDWGTWASFVQRHILSMLEEGNRHLGYNLGEPEKASSHRKQAREQFGSMIRFPLLAERWQSLLQAQQLQKGTFDPRNPIEQQECDQTLPLVQKAPELVPATAWDGVLRFCSRARNSGALPAYIPWFSPVLPKGTVFDVERRLRLVDSPPFFDLTRLEALRTEAPYERALVLAYVKARYGSKPKATEIAAAAGPLAEYDLAIMTERANAAWGDPIEYRPLAEGLCRLDAGKCIALGDFLSQYQEDEPAAAAAYERAVNKALDRVSVANNCDWLVNYYFDQGMTEKAIKVASMAAEVYSGGGLQIMGRTLERMGRYAEAEAYYQKIAKRYDKSADLDQFYIRREHRAPDGPYRTQAAAAAKAVFPAGIQRVSLADFHAPPTDGQPVEEPLLPKFRRFGARLGDVIVALDGFRVQNAAQYFCIRGLSDDPNMTAIVWRNGRYEEIKGQFKRRRFGP
jgi:tetratricopeptide (TPR) repeat protein